MRSRALIPLVLAGTALVGGVLPAPAATAATSVKILQLNICHSGSAPCFTGDKVIDKAVEVIKAEKPQVISVNEACSGDLATLKAAAGDMTTKFVAAKRTNGNTVTCKNGDDYGNIIMLSSDLAGSGATSSGLYANQYESANEDRAWACIAGTKLAACSTHLTYGSESTALAQCKELLDRAVGFAETRPAVVAGDLNLKSSGTTNAGQCTPTGFYRKGDGDVQHIFGSDSAAYSSSKTIDMDGTTDHPGWVVNTTIS